MKKTFRKWYDKLLSRLLTILGFSSTFAYMACYAPPPEELDYLSVNPLEFHFPSEGGMRNMNISTEDAWRFSGVPSFISVSPITGKGDSYVCIAVDKNREKYGRSGTFSVEGIRGKTNQTVFYTQESNPYILKVTPESLTFSYEQLQIDSVFVFADGTWRVEQSSSFVEVTPTIGVGNSKLYVTTLTENRDSSIRTGMIMIVDENCDNVVELNIIQKGKSE